MTRSSMRCICLVLLVFLSVVRTEWVYPVLTATEGRMRQSEILLNQIGSSDPNVVRYTFSGPGADKFRIDDEGKVYQVKELDREEKATYVLMASAFDMNDQPVEKDQELSIVVLDINDNVPIFVDETLTGTVSEGAAPGDVFMKVSATDADDANTFNAEVVYKIEPGSDSPASDKGSRFAVDNIGQVSVLGNLDYETDPIVSFLVLAIDGGGVGNGLNTATASVTVTLTDSNDHAPVFDASTLPAVKPLSELSGLSTPLYNIYADDADMGKNKKVYFDITSGNIGGTFEIVSTPSDTGKSLGELQLVKPLDFESGTTEYTLTVRAYNKDSDNPADIKYQKTDTLTIKVTDANEAPVFKNTPYTGIVSENDDAPTGNEAVPIDVKVSAEDYDFGGNQTVSFFLNDPWFQINEKSGEISRVAKVDREAPRVKNGIYVMTVVATDNYDHPDPASGNADVSITIQDINDNPPSPGWGEEESVKICEEPANDTVKLIVASDPDSAANGSPFTFRLAEDFIDTDKWGIRYVDDVSSEIISKFDNYDLSGGTETVLIPFTITDSGSPLQTGTATLTVTVCKCDDNGEPTCRDAQAAGFPIAIVIAIIAVLLLIMILIFALVAYKRRQASLELKEPFFDDEDDIRETVQMYQEEGGEEDHDAYDLSALRAPLMEDPNQPVRIEKPLQQAPRAPRGGHIPDDIGDYIGDAKDQADADPSAPPFDSLLVFDYEGLGSDAGSLSSINTATTDGSVDYDHLNNWGPRFKGIADMYNDGSESE